MNPSLTHLDQGTAPEIAHQRSPAPRSLSERTAVTIRPHAAAAARRTASLTGHAYTLPLVRELTAQPAVAHAADHNW